MNLICSCEALYGGAKYLAKIVHIFIYATYRIVFAVLRCSCASF